MPMCVLYHPCANLAPLDPCGIMIPCSLPNTSFEKPPPAPEHVTSLFFLPIALQYLVDNGCLATLCEAAAMPAHSIPALRCLHYTLFMAQRPVRGNPAPSPPLFRLISCHACPCYTKVLLCMLGFVNRVCIPAAM